MRLQVAGVDINSSTFAASFVTDWVLMSGRTNLSLELTFTGDAVGAFTLERANSTLGGATIANTSTDPASGSPVYYHVTGLNAKRVRLRYVRTSGTLTAMSAFAEVR